MPTSPAPIARLPFGVIALAPLLWRRPRARARGSVATSPLFIAIQVSR
jgi:hypothetical protein